MILDTEISIYNCVTDNTGRTATFADFLRLCHAYADKVAAARVAYDSGNRELYDAIKRQLPAATLSGTFSPTRGKNNLQQHSGLIAVDIDHVEDCAALMNKLTDMENVAYCSRSLSGHGIFAIIPVKYPHKHAEHFEALRRLFADMGVTLDEQCKDTARLRVISYDPDARLRLDAVPFVGLWSEPVQQPPRPRRARTFADGIAFDTTDLGSRLYEVLSAYHLPARQNAHYKIPCPFHAEKSASCDIDTRLGLWHCFGCGLGGDALSFVAAIEGLDPRKDFKIIANIIATL